MGSNLRLPERQTVQAMSKYKFLKPEENEWSEMKSDGWITYWSVREEGERTSLGAISYDEKHMASQPEYAQD